jgi:hypothetical protein
MKLIVIGDTHGRDTWKYYPLNEYDKVIFIGDYVDSYDKTDEEIIKNLQDIIQYKKDNMDRCVLLLGNHDVMYLFSYSSHGCSGFRLTYYHTLHHLFESNKDLFQTAYQINMFDKKYLFTHAGVTSIWWKRFQKSLKDNSYETLNSSMADILNNEFKLNNYTLFEVGSMRGGGHKSGGPFWADKSESTAWSLPNYCQIVGHTPVKEICTHEWREGNSSITYCDNIGYYELEI